MIHCFSEKIKLDVSSESSARQRIHMKNQALFSSKYKSKELKYRLLQVLLGVLRVNVFGTIQRTFSAGSKVYLSYFLMFLIKEREIFVYVFLCRTM